MMEFLQDTNSWVLISFLIFAILAYVKGKGVITAILDEKIEQIEKDIKAAETMRVEAQELLAQYQRKNREAEKQAIEIVETAKDRVAEMKKEAQKRIKDDMKRREEQLEDRLALMEEKAMADIQQHASNLTLAATREIIANAMSQKENDRLNSEVLKELSSQTLH